MRHLKKEYKIECRNCGEVMVKESVATPPYFGTCDECGEYELMEVADRQ